MIELPMESTAYLWFDTEYSSLELSGAHLLQVAMVITDVHLKRILPPEEDVILAILDLNLPDASGLDILREIRRTHSALPVILSSGYDASELPKELMEDRHLRFLRKPYQIATFWEAFDSVVS